MSAGTGITHAEYNLEVEATTLFQLWITSDRAVEQPSWGQREFPKGARAGRFTVLASGDPDGDDALPIRAEARVMAATLAVGQSASWQADPARHQYLVPINGRVRVNGREAARGTDWRSLARPLSRSRRSTMRSKWCWSTAASSAEAEAPQRAVEHQQLPQ